MKRVLLKITLLVVILALLSLGAGLYILNKNILPSKIKPYLVKALSSSLKHEVEIEGLSYSFPFKIGLNGVIIYERQIPAQKLLKIDSATISLHPLPLLLKRLISINSMYLKTLEVYPGPGHTFSSKGDISLKGMLQMTIDRPQTLNYDMTMALIDQDIKDMPVVGDISSLNGRIRIIPNRISIIQSKGLSYGCPIEYEGYLENFTDPYVEFTEKIDLNLEKLHFFLSKRIREAIKQVSFTGESKVKLTMYGKFSQWPLKVKGNASVLDAGIKVPVLVKPIEKINTQVTFDENSLTLPELNANYNDQSYIVKGNISNFTAPEVFIELISENLSFNAEFATFEDYIHFKKIEGTLFNSGLSLTGDLQDFKDPQLKLSGNLILNLEDVQRIILKFIGENKNILSFLDSVKPRGICNTSFFLDGPVKKIKDSEIGLRAGSSGIGLYGFNMGTFRMNAQMKDKIIAIPELEFAPYDGALAIGAMIDFSGKDKTQSPPVYNIEINASGIELSKLIQDTKIQDKKIQGKFFLQGILNGWGYDLGRLNGQGRLSVTDGYLWEFPILGMIADLLSLPALKKVTIKEAAGNFIVMNKKITTQDLTFTSEQLYMIARGSLGFEGGLDFGVALSLAPKFLHQNQLGMLTGLIADQTGRLAGEIKITGTLKEPKHKFVPLGLDKVISNKLFEGLRKIFKK